MLAEMDARHGPVFGLATKKLMERACRVFGEACFERLAGISVSHLYNLRGGTPYPPPCFRKDVVRVDINLPIRLIAK